MAKQTQKQKNPNSSKKKKVTIGVICGLLGAGAIAAGLAVGLTQCSPQPEPSEKLTVTFSTGGDKDIHIDGPTIVELEPGQTFGDARKQVTVTKIVDNVEWAFDCWASKQSFNPDEEYPKVLDSTVITQDITVYPYFIEPKEEYIEKTVSWEDIGTEESPQPADKVFTLAESENSITISNFVLHDAEGNPTDRQEGEIVTVKAEKVTSDKREIDIDAEFITSQVTMGRLSVLFTINKDKEITEDLYENPIVFNVNFTLHYKGNDYEQETIEGLTINLTKPWEFPNITYEGEKVTVFKTSNGVKSYKLDSKTNGEEGKNSYFVIEKPLVDDETLNVACIDPTTGEPVEDLEVTHLVQNSNDGTKAFIDLNLSFTKVRSYFADEEKTFKLKFWITFNSTGRDSDPYIYDDVFTIKYNACQTPPYCLAMDQAYVNDTGLNAFEVPAKIVNKEHNYFEEGDFLIVSNLTRIQEGLEESPIWFSTPQEKDHPKRYGDENECIPLEGNNKEDQLLEIYFDYDEQNGIVAPTEITTYPTKIQIEFYHGNPIEDPEGAEQIGETVTQTIDFTYVPPGNLSGSYDQWMQYRSVGFIARATEKGTGEVKQALGTGWILSKNPSSKAIRGSDWSYYLATSWDYREKADDLIHDPKDKYEDGSAYFGIVSSLSAKQYVPGDKTKYALLEPTEDGLFNDDVLDLDLTGGIQGGEPIRWVNQGELVWPDKQHPWIGEDYYDASNIAIAEIDLACSISEPYNGNLWSRYFIPQLDILTEWARREGLTEGQRTKVFEDMPDQFKQRNYARAVTAGFDTKEIEVTKDGHTKTVPAFYWRSYEMAIGGNKINYISQFWNASVHDPFGYYDVGDDKNILVDHDCGAFAFEWDSFPISDYFGEAGTGAMFVLIPNGSTLGTFGTPEVAGINWNGRSMFNKGSTITPYFDLLQINGYRVLEAKHGRTNYLKPEA